MSYWSQGKKSEHNVPAVGVVVDADVEHLVDSHNFSFLFYAWVDFRLKCDT